MPIRFRSLVPLLAARQGLEEKLTDIGLPEEAAHRSAFEMSAASEGQLLADFERAAKYMKLKHTPSGVSADSFEFNNESDVQNFLDLITQERNKQAYLKKYMHQGGFMNTAELLMTYYFRTAHTDNEMLMVQTDNRGFEIVVNEDNSITIIESFDINELKTPGGVEYKPDEGPVATVKLKSRISVNDQGELSHDYEPLEIEARDKSAKVLFEDPSSFLNKFIQWFKDTIQSVISPAVREHNRQMRELPTQSKKL